MNVVAQTFPKAFLVSFSGIKRWDPNSFHCIQWHWPPSMMAPIGTVLSPRKEKTDRSNISFSDLMPVTIHFDGSIEPRKVSGDKEYTMELFWARPGDIVASKIDLKNGAVAIIPDKWDKAVVTNHFAIYESDLDRLDPKYFHLLIQTRFFKEHLWRNKVGAEGRKEVKLEFFESLEVPVPPLSVQQKIVAYWEAAIAKASLLEDKSKATIDESSRTFFHELGLSIPKKQESEKVFIRQWKDFDRWSVNYNQAASTMMDLSKGKFPVVELGSILDLVQYGTSEKANTNQRGMSILRINNIKKGYIDTTDLKYISLGKKILKNLALSDGDILIIRTSGSRDLVGTCAVFHEKGEFVYASYLIRLRVSNQNALSDYVSSFINSPVGRQQVNLLSRHIMQNNINSQELKSLKIPLPPLAVQRKMVQRINYYRQEAALLNTSAKEVLEKVTIGVEQMILGTRSVEGI